MLPSCGPPGPAETHQTGGDPSNRRNCGLMPSRGPGQQPTRRKTSHINKILTYSFAALVPKITAYQSDHVRRINHSHHRERVTSMFGEAILLIVLAVLTAGSIGAGFWLWWKNRDLAERHRKEVERQNEAVNHLEQLNTDLEKAVASLVETTAIQRSAVRNIRRSVVFVFVVVAVVALALAFSGM